MITLNEKYVRSKIVKRTRTAHKGDFGKVLIFAGSEGMAGAAVLCGRAALRSGAGLVRYLLPSSGSRLQNILQISVPEATCVTYSEDMDFSEYSAIACGCGLGKGRNASHILKAILKRYDGLLVLDADALNMIAASNNMISLVQSSQAMIIMTPHPGEAKRLLGHDLETVSKEPGQIPGQYTLFDPAEKQENDLPHPDRELKKDTDWTDPDDRLAVLNRLSEKYYSIIVLKGCGTLVGTTENTFINTTGNPGMATGGSGDVLTGIIAALGGQGYKPIDCAACGVYVHGLAGDKAASKNSEIGMTSSDIIDMLPSAWKEVYPS